MKVCFLHADDAEEIGLAQAFAAGVSAAGDEGYTVAKGHPDWMDADCVAMVGVKSYRSWQDCQDMGQRTILVDRGYFRANKFFRFSIDYHNPTGYVAMARHDGKRWDALHETVGPWHDGKYVLIAGSSAKYHKWYGLDGDPNSYCESIANRLIKLGCQVMYRPKVGWRGKRPITGTEYHRLSNMGAGRANYGIFRALLKASCLVTHGSNACVEALAYGVPAVVLGSGVTRCVSSTHVEDALDPRKADMDARRQVLANLAWCQFSRNEMSEGFAWRHLRTVLDADPALLKV